MLLKLLAVFCERMLVAAAASSVRVLNLRCFNAQTCLRWPLLCCVMKDAMSLLHQGVTLDAMGQHGSKESSVSHCHGARRWHPRIDQIVIGTTSMGGCSSAMEDRRQSS